MGSVRHDSLTPRGKTVAPNIIDIRQEDLIPLAEQIRSGLRPKDGGEKRLPTLLLYNEKGLKLFEKITYLDEYYLTGQEIEVLEKYADRIADRVALEPESVIVELGSGYAPRPVAPGYAW